jgi:hypothetical protein
MIVGMFQVDAFDRNLSTIPESVDESPEFGDVDHANGWLAVRKHEQGTNVANINDLWQWDKSKDIHCCEGSRLAKSCSPGKDCNNGPISSPLVLARCSIRT